MATLVDVVNAKNETVDRCELPEAIFSAPVKPPCCTRWCGCSSPRRRQGTAETKGRSDVSGGGKKPWKQKGTGRARSGSSRSPLWRHGGTVFGPHPRSYEFGVPKAIRRQALLAALTSKAQAGAIRVLESLGLERPSTKAMAALLKGAGVAGKALVVLPARDETLEKSARNLPAVRVLTVQGLNVYDVLNHDHLFLVQSAIPKIEEALIS